MRSLLLPFLFAAPLVAQPSRPATTEIAELRIRITNTEHAPVAGSGVLPFDRQGLIATVAVIGVDAAGRPVPGARLGAVRWTTTDEKVVSIYDDPAGASVRVVAQHDGRAALTVTAAGGKTATLPVVVGQARHEIAANELTAKFRVARLEVVAEKGNAGPNAEVTSGRLRLKTNGHGALLKARAYAADGTVIPVEHLPVAWSTGDEKVVELYQTGTESTQLTARAPGSTTLTASIQGVTATVSAEVLPDGTEVGTLAGTELVATATASLPVVKGETALPITVRPAPTDSTASSARTRDLTAVSAGELRARLTSDVVTRSIATKGFAASGGYVAFVVARSITTSGFTADAGYVAPVVTRTITTKGFTNQAP